MYGYNIRLELHMEIEQRYVVSYLHRKWMKLPAIVAEPAAVYHEDAFDENRVKYWLHEIKLHRSDLSDRQIVFFHDFVQNECGRTLTASQIATIFGIQSEQVRKIRCKAQSKGKSPHRSFALDTNQDAAVVGFIQAEYSTGNFVRRRDLLNFVEREFQKRLTCSWIRSFLARNAFWVCAVTVSPQTKGRMEVPRHFLDEYLKLIKECVPSELIFDINECGFSDPEERKEKLVIIPAETQAITLH
jgi:hypothetical protein